MGADVKKAKKDSEMLDMAEYFAIIKPRPKIGAFLNEEKGVEMKTNSLAKALALSSSFAALVAGCGSPNYELSEHHITDEQVAEEEPVSVENIPQLVRRSPTLPALELSEGAETFSVVVTKVDVQELLFALARDAGVDMDIDSRVGGIVSISAIDETLDSILERIAIQIDIRVEVHGDSITVLPDEPFFKQYVLDYVNLDRTGSSSASIQGNLAGGAGGTSSASVSNTGDNNFWAALEDSLDELLDVEITEGEDSSDERVSAGEERETRLDAEESTYTIHRPTGVILVYANGKQHKQVQELLDRIGEIAGRQVLLEATVVEVVLNNRYQQGIDWSYLNKKFGLTQSTGFGGTNGLPGPVGAIVGQVLQSQSRVFNFDHTLTGQALTDARNAAQLAASQYAAGNRGEGVPEIEDISVGEDNVVGYSVTREAYTTDRPNAGTLIPHRSPEDGNFLTGTFRSGDLTAAVDLLERFGDAKVISSPRVSTLNNQPALLQVVDNLVYFRVEVEEEIDEDADTVTREITVEEEIIPIGFSMNVMPQISRDGIVMLNLKPSVTRVVDRVEVPNPRGASSVRTFIPIVRVRELESVMALRDGEVAVLGGLLEDRTADINSNVPGLGKLPGIGTLFEHKNEQTFKSEWVVFIRARIVKNPSLFGDYSEYRNLLPDTDFLRRKEGNTLFPPPQIGQ